ncbi:RsmB/NOP family class I SAM-dependent RNA methyltransferase [Candidatus Micrarchaeota archaeon]|nr:RsmB/NOP family class I SAM-dependent RNA methyltransferase [Candidatus Micrarchaeota archaeon]
MSSRSLPNSFIERYRDLPDDPEAFFSSLMTLLPKTFRVNTIKANRDFVVSKFGEYGISCEPASWYCDAFTTKNLNVGATLEHFLGQIYIQEFTSMLPPLLIRDELSSSSFVFDCCAAPGSKTTQMAALMSNKGTLVANDVDYDRIRALRFNLEKTGVLNTVITNQDLRHVTEKNFEIVLLDAPCSAEGTMRKSYGVLDIWGEKLIKYHSGLSKQLILKAFDALAPGGTMVYSTCTFAPDENEAVLDHLISNRASAKLLPVTIDGFKLGKPTLDWHGQQFSSEIRSAARVWPHDNDTDGFFLAKVTRNE